MDDMRSAGQATATSAAKITARGVQVYYGQNHALKDVSVDILDRAVTAFIGPSGCGKSTFLRCLNRMNDTVASARVEGRITLDGQDIHDPRIDPVADDLATLALDLLVDEAGYGRSGPNLLLVNAAG